ncbi:WD repeat-containing protein 97-like [Anabrus simplex]|uniref:WD repeat-containing protein 97-like n=1 Tax=Anabrus simplex TaxID=316456 RepID=UPI0035A3C1A9
MDFGTVEMAEEATHPSEGVQMEPTALQDEEVKCWDLEWKILMVFAGHEGMITHILPHPGLCGFITSGHDRCLIAWSCALRDMVEKIRLVGRVRAISLNWKEKCIAVLSDIVEVWRMHKVYDFHSALSAPPTMLYTTMNPCYPCRTVVLCADSSVRLISPVTGEQLTVQISPSLMKVQHAAYSSYSDILYTSMDFKNRIMLSFCDENPVKFWKAWSFQGSYVPTVTSLAVFEHIARDRNLIKGVVDPLQREHNTSSVVLVLTSSSYADQ